MAIVLHELCGADPEIRFSPFCWRARMALAHKGLNYETRPAPFTDIPGIAPSAGRTVPILTDGDRTICDSWEIARYLEETYPDRPSLFGGGGGFAIGKQIESWVNASVSSVVVTLVLKDIHDRLAPADQAYFRESREKRYGRSLEAVQEGREDRLAALATALLPLHLTLKHQPFIGGDTPLYADYILFGTLQWPRVVSDFPLLEPGRPVSDWFERCLDLFDGLGRSAKRAVTT